MAQAGPIPISYVPTSRGPQRHLGNVESPLASLVRRTSSRRVHRNENENEPQQERSLDQPPRVAVQTVGGDTRIYEDEEDEDEDWRSETYAAYEPSDTDSAYDYNYTLTPTQPDQQFYDQQQTRGSVHADTGQYAFEAGPSTSTRRALPTPPRTTGTDGDTQRLFGTLRIDVPPPSAPPSPLLHGHFTRDSQATASEYSDWDANGSMRSSTHSLGGRSQDADADADTDTARGQFPFQGAGPVSPTASEGSRYSEYEYYKGEGYEENAYASNGADASALRDSWNSTATGGTVRRPEYYMPPAGAGAGVPWGGAGRGGGTLVVKPVTNFSRPVRESGVPGQAMGERVTPQLPPDMHAQKQKVLERNALRPANNSNNSNFSGNSNNSNSSSNSNNSLHPESRSTARTGTTTREITPASAVYSDYSYYQFSSAAPSPMDGGFPREGGRTATGGKKVGFKEAVVVSGSRTPQDYLQLGIQHHEANRLGESARCFERSAKEEGGCGVGMLMYGLALRHGWGCVKNEKMAFKWLMKAAECAVGDLERMRRSGGDGDAGVVETELVLAIYEVGQCFFHGWGVVKDQKMAVSYYTVAAKLGDGDAQADLGYCLANGKGCKKDKQSAAQWYRAAVQQGQSDLGLGWIYKDKYQAQ